METDYLDILENLCALNGKLEAIIESSTNGIVEIDRKGTIVSCNPLFRRIFHTECPKEKVQSIYELFDEDIRIELKRFFNKGDEVFLRDIIIPAETGREDRKFLEIKIIPLPAVKEIFFIGIFKDKTDVLTALNNREKFITILLNLIGDIKVDNRNTIYHIASLVDLRDTITGTHLERVETYTRLLASEYLKVYGNRDEWVSESYVEDMAVSSVLHDIGKIGISDSILLKPHELSKLEMDAMRQHTIIAGDALERHRGKKDFLAMGREIALTHHEKWNGQGYPHGLKGKEIPLSGRIVAICDTYDAITTNRPYKEARSHETAMAIIRKERSLSFDPEVVDLFISINKQFKAVKKNE